MKSARSDRVGLSQSALKVHYRRTMWYRILEGEYPIDEWIERVQFMAEQDETIDWQKKWAKRGMVWSLVALFFSLFLSLIEFTLPLMLIVLLVSIAFLILRRMDVPNRLKVTILPMLMILREDAAPKGKLRLRVDLTGAERDAKQLDEETLIDTSRKRVVQTRFFDPWLQGSLLLCDGTQLKWEVSEVLRRRKIRKSTVRKTKFKTKYKVKTQVDLSLTVKRDRYQVETSSKPGSPQLKKQGERKSVLRYRRGLAISTNPDEEFDLNGFLYTISTAYQCLKPLG